jgi:hypothetical protein
MKSLIIIIGAITVPYSAVSLASPLQPVMAATTVAPAVSFGATQTFVAAVDLDDPAAGYADTLFTMFGRTMQLRAWVVFPGPPYLAGSTYPPPNGHVVLRLDGNEFASTALGHMCTDCSSLTFSFFFRLNAFPFGDHQLTASYEGDTGYESSTSAPKTLIVAPESTIPTATQAGQSLVGTTGGVLDGWSCALDNPTWQSIAAVGTAASSAPYDFPYGLLRYRLDQCFYGSPIFLAPPPLFQVLVIELPAPLPLGTVFVNYGPTRDNLMPHWYELPAQVDGATVRISLRDSDPGDDELTTYGVIAGLGGPALPSIPTTTAQVVEFYAVSLDHYFMSVDAAEIAALDAHTIAGWERTGMSFSAYLNAAANTQPVCRFYIPPKDGDSHFYSASALECAQTRARFPEFVYESPDVFHIALPDVATGACPVETIPVYRVWNQRADSNHRYTASRTVRDQMLTRGYVAEGYGPDAVIMCAAP